MKFKYQARTQQGEPQVGMVEAVNRDAAINILEGHDLFVLSIEAGERIGLFDRVASYFSRVRTKDMVVFTRQMATLLEARLPLTDVLTTLYDQTSQPTLKQAVADIAEDVDAGLPISQALGRQKGIFSSFFVSMVQSAELTGNLEKVVGFMADYYEKEAELASKARSALIYPSIIIGLFVVVAFIMLTVVFPQVQPVFEQSGIELPFFTRVLIWLGNFLGAWWLALLAVLIIGIVVVLDYFRTEEGEALRDDLIVRMPIAKKVYLPLIITRISNTSSMLLKGGIPMAQAIEVVSQSIDNVLYRDLLRNVSQEVRQGTRLAAALGNYPTYFPPLFTQMIAVGETTGQVDEMFTRTAQFYGRETDDTINNLVDLIQPVLMVGIGALVGLLFASILLPLYQLTATIQ